MTKNKKENNINDENKITEQEDAKSAETELSDKKISDSVNESDAKISELETQVKDWQDKFLRKAAEFENYKRRTENDQFNLVNYAAESFVLKLLPIVDDFERSMEHFDDIDDKSVKDGIKLVYEKLLKMLSEQGVKKMQTIGEPFNVAYHDALMQKDDNSVPSHTVLEEVEPGYLYRDKVIRHAKVIVSSDSSTDTEQQDENSSNP